MEPKHREGRVRLVFLSLFLLGTFGYLFTNRLNDGRAIERVIVSTPLDALIPLVPIFVIPYVLWSVYVAGTLLVLFLDRSDRYYRFVLSVFFSMVVATLVFYFFPTYMQRPELTGSGPLYAVLRWIYSMDRPFNSLPSTHVLYSTLVAWNLYKWKPEAKAFQVVNFTTCVLICVSTVFVKQHNTPDIPTGIALAMVFNLLLDIPKEVHPWPKSRSIPVSADS